MTTDHHIAINLNVITRFIVLILHVILARGTAVAAEHDDATLRKKVEDDFKHVHWVFIRQADTMSDEEKRIQDAFIYAARRTAQVRHQPVSSAQPTPKTTRVGISTWIENIYLMIENVHQQVGLGKTRRPCMAISIPHRQLAEHSDTRIRVQWLPYPYEPERREDTLQLVNDEEITCPSDCGITGPGWSITLPVDGNSNHQKDIVTTGDKTPEWMTNLTFRINQIVQRRQKQVLQELLPENPSNPVTAPEQRQSYAAVPLNQENPPVIAEVPSVASAAMVSLSPPVTARRRLPTAYTASIAALWASGALLSSTGLVLFGLNNINDIATNENGRINGLAPAAYTATLMSVPIFVISIPLTLYYLRDRQNHVITVH